MKTIQDGEEVKNTNNISDGYHTFGELYKHRIHLFIALCNIYKNCYKSKKHNDGSCYDGWFILQLETDKGQISYHLPMEYWNKCNSAKELELANKWDGHNSEDVLYRLLNITN